MIEQFQSLLAASLPENLAMRQCWQFLDAAATAGWLSPDALNPLLTQLKAGIDIGIEEFAIEHIDGLLRVSFLDDCVFCDEAVFVDAIARLLVLANETRTP